MPPGLFGPTLGGGFSDTLQASPSGFLSHGFEGCVERELRNWLRQVLVERVGALLPNFPGLRAVFVAVTII